MRVLNPDRVIKHVDGDYDPPSDTLPDNHCYCGWYNGHGLELGKLHRGLSGCRSSATGSTPAASSARRDSTPPT